MSTTYHSSLPVYDSHAIHGYPTMAPHATRPKAVMDDGRSTQSHRYPPHAAQLASVGHARSNNASSLSASQLSHTASQSSTRPSTPTPEVFEAAKGENTATRRGSDTLIYHSLQIPKCISPNGGSLSDFAAQMTCLFWFESVDNLKLAESVRSRPPNAPVPRLPALAKPYEQFQKWVYNVLSTTQVTQNVIFLALLFIYRLKMSTPQIKGRAGSEYRLLTVALMLGNKFLDDNTYTNKTWAEVSCFAVQEIHVMEVEFLSNMRYNLLASKTEWEDWLVKLACFHDYYDRALKLPASPVHVPSPLGKAFNSPIPSPTGMTHPGIPDMPQYTPVAAIQLSPTSTHSKNFSAYQTNTTSPLGPKRAMNLPATRKRSPEEDLADHPAKRHVPTRVGQVPPVTSASCRPAVPIEAARLPVPQLTVITNPAQHAAKPYPAVNAYGPQVPATGHQQVVSLPPLQPGIRAMTTVYQPNPVANLVQQQPVMPVTSGNGMGPAVAYQAAAPVVHPAVNYGTPTKHHSPGNLAPFGSSPLVEHLGPVSAVHTPISNSPSVYLQQRASPYKPVRHVNRLLYPPSASLDQYHLSVPVAPSQMHYQPLGRRHDVRTGIVPEFVVYQRGQQQHHMGSQPGHQGHYPS
ncbi:mucin [Purpureocillium lilacinum]|nr:mucin [Purpureocillium lilacinum]OAQ78974.1 mucin [Purpureocillium lilacinum]OAQ93275.1 mucin [Purpureocillium lilacinum]GJN71735.1 hypothetical protein PLICBS_005803 [Purpureocillium lilacinum]GJN82391.1 hypothetical protein PLIIFM63780_005931 [Purpureocillium lilacinum]